MSNVIRYDVARFYLEDCTVDVWNGYWALAQIGDQGANYGDLLGGLEPKLDALITLVDKAVKGEGVEQHDMDLALLGDANSWVLREHNEYVTSGDMDELRVLQEVLHEVKKVAYAD